MKKEGSESSEFETSFTNLGFGETPSQLFPLGTEVETGRNNTAFTSNRSVVLIPFTQAFSFLDESEWYFCVKLILNEKALTAQLEWKIKRKIWGKYRETFLDFLLHGSKRLIIGYGRCNLEDRWTSVFLICYVGVRVRIIVLHSCNAFIISTLHY